MQILIFIGTLAAILGVIIVFGNGGFLLKKYRAYESNPKLVERNIGRFLIFTGMFTMFLPFIVFKLGNLGYLLFVLSLLIAILRVIFNLHPGFSFRKKKNRP